MRGGCVWGGHTHTRGNYTIKDIWGGWRLPDRQPHNESASLRVPVCVCACVCAQVDGKAEPTSQVAELARASALACRGAHSGACINVHAWFCSPLCKATARTPLRALRLQNRHTKCSNALLCGTYARAVRACYIINAEPMPACYAMQQK